MLDTTTTCKNCGNMWKVGLFDPTCPRCGRDPSKDRFKIFKVTKEMEESIRGSALTMIKETTQ